MLKKLSWLLIEAVVASSRVTISGHDKITGLLNEKLPVIFIFWHRHLLFVIHQFKNSGARPLISLSSDGELVTAVAQEFGMKPIRGSSSKGGARAFLNMVRSVQEENAQVLITVDGPKGPARQIKTGTVQLALKTKAHIIPISWSSSRVKILEKSWDRFMIPLPFGRIHFAYGQPLQISASDEANLQKTADMLAEKLNQLEESVK
ncbi:MAG: lysophospholipid acyltransferase family protein [Candidatus Aminicenantes bacterium]|nr:lysophospholipid acyltransferase family protein [Candidatus Aminicenantes bacterium]